MNAMDKRPSTVIVRDRITTVAASVDGFSEGVTMAAQCGQASSPLAVSLFRVLLGHVKAITSNVGLEEWPELSSDATLADLVVASRTLRSLFFSFLTPEQLKEYRETTSAFRMAEFNRQRTESSE